MDGIHTKPAEAQKHEVANAKIESKHINLDLVNILVKEKRRTIYFQDDSDIMLGYSANRYEFGVSICTLSTPLNIPQIR